MKITILKCDLCEDEDTQECSCLSADWVEIEVTLQRVVSGPDTRKKDICPTCAGKINEVRAGILARVRQKKADEAKEWLADKPGSSL
jgi:hypothetical protein